MDKTQYTRPQVNVGDIHYALYQGEFFPTIVYRISKTQFWFSGKCNDQLISSTLGTDMHFFRPTQALNDYEQAPNTPSPLFDEPQL